MMSGHDGDPDNDDDDVVRRDQQPVHVQGGDGKGDRGEGERKKGGTSKPDSGVVVTPCVLHNLKRYSENHYGQPT